MATEMVAKCADWVIEDDTVLVVAIRWMEDQQYHELQLWQYELKFELLAGAENDILISP